MQCPPKKEGGAPSLLAPGGDLDAEVDEGLLGKGDWLAPKVRNVLPEHWAQGQMLMTVGGCWYPLSASSKEVGSVGVLVGVGEVGGTGKVRGTDSLEKSTCSPRVHPPFRPKLSGRNCGCHHGNSQ